MKITGRDKLSKFGAKHNRAIKPIKMWIRTVENSAWKNSADVKATFSSVDNPAKGQYIFNLGGNKFRLVAIIKVVNGVVIVDRIMTHAEYDKWNKGK